MDNPTGAYPFTQNRELSWLKFNLRVLEEAEDIRVPLLERLRFASIFISNLDEFFMIRVGSLTDLATVDGDTVDNKSGLTPRQQLDAIFHEVAPLYSRRDRAFFQIERGLRQHGIESLAWGELEQEDKDYLKQYYRNEVLPLLSPQVVDTHHPFPFIPNGVVHVAALLRAKKGVVLGLVPLPANLPEIIVLPGRRLRYLNLEKLLYHYVDDLFGMYEVAEKTLIRVTRNADVNPDAEELDHDQDFRSLMSMLIRKRRRMAVVRLEVARTLSADLSAYLCDKLGIAPAQIFRASAPIGLGYVSLLMAEIPRQEQTPLLYRAFRPALKPGVEYEGSIIRQVMRQDLLLHFPYESMDTFLQLIKEAAYDPEVVSIKITIYRLASQSKLVDYLSTAAEMGKEVVVIIELRARFDEQNNIDWSHKLESFGCRVVFGLEDFKVHSKLCLITRKERGKLAYITQVGTGNYNEVTARLYTDFSLITANQEIGLDAVEFFQNLLIGNTEGEYHHLMVAPNSMKNRILAEMEREIAKGAAGRIMFKVNSITDIDVINELQRASAAGVQVQMIVRGICCILPGVPGYTERLSVISIVGRFLEHTRVYRFGEGEEQRMYISSADLMTRNMQRRVELACPVYDPEIRRQINHVLELAWRDDVKARVLTKDGTYYKKSEGTVPLNSQQALIEEAALAERRAMKLPGGGAARPLAWVQNALARLLGRRV